MENEIRYRNIAVHTRGVGHKLCGPCVQKNTHTHKSLVSSFAYITLKKSIIQKQCFKKEIPQEQHWQLGNPDQVQLQPTWSKTHCTKAPDRWPQHIPNSQSCLILNKLLIAPSSGSGHPISENNVQKTAATSTKALEQLTTRQD